MTAQAATEREIRDFVRHRRKEHDPRRGSDRLLNAYMGALGVVYLVVAVSGYINPDLTPQPDKFLDTIAWLPVILLVVVWMVLRFATWQGPVLFPGPELQWVLSAPLSRRTMVLLRLRRALLIAGVGGAAGGVVAAIVADVMIGEGLITVFVVATAGLGALALMATALSWQIERSSKLSNIVNRVSPLVVVIAVLLAVAAVRGWDTAVWWSGPWGWATGPIVAEAGWPVTGWVVQAVLLGAATAAAIFAAIRTADQVPDEELWRRAEARSAAAAALFFGDIRVIKNVSRRMRIGNRSRGRAFQLLRVRKPLLVIVARDALNLRRNPGLAGTAAMFVAAASTAAVAAVDRPVLGVGTFIGLYAAASRLLEPVRLEVDRPAAHRMLPWSWGTVLAMHCIVPIITLTILGWAAIAGMGIGGFIPGSAVLSLLVVVPFAAGGLVAPAAISAVRKPFPVETLISGAESSSLILVVWLVVAPALAGIIVNIAFSILRPSLDQGVTGETLGAAMFLTTATLAIISWLSTRKAPE